MRRPGSPPYARRPAPELVFTSWSSRRPHGVSYFLISLCLHINLVGALVALDLAAGPRSFPAPTVEQLMAGERHQLIWYTPQRQLPAVAPLETKQDISSGSRPRFRSPQRIVASDPNATSRRQMIWDPAPRIELQQDLPSPNLLAWSPSKVSRPRFEMAPPASAQPRRQALQPQQAPRIASQANPFLEAVPTQPSRLRYWEAQPQLAAPVRQAVTAEQAPQLPASAKAAVDLQQVQPLGPLRYWSEQQQRAAPRNSLLPSAAAPNIRATPGAAAGLNGVEQLPRLRYWAPQESPAAAPAGPVIAADDAPVVSAAPGGDSTLAYAQRLAPLRYQTFGSSGAPAGPGRQALAAVAGSTAPAAGGGPGGDPSAASQVAAVATAQSLAALDSLASPGGAGAASGDGTGALSQGGSGLGDGQPSLAVVGLDPDPNAPPLAPGGRRRGRFAAGPDGGPGGDDGAAGNAPGDGSGGSSTVAALRVPYLSISGAPPGAPAGLAAVVSPPSTPAASATEPDRNTLLRSLRNAPLQSAPQIPGQAPAPPDNPDLLLTGRAVYTLAVNMPNVTSYSGSWIIEFAELDEARGQGEVMPPSPVYKVDPKYVRAAADEEIEGDVILHAMIRSDGLVDHIRIMKSLDDRLDQSASAALAKWRFQPATKGGLPIDVETVVRIPFRLTPLEDKRR